MSKRRTYSHEQREAWVAKFNQTKTTARAFCREHDLDYASFLRWRRRLRQEKTCNTSIDFIEVELPPAPMSGPGPLNQSVELIFPGGLTLRIQSSPTI